MKVPKQPKKADCTNLGVKKSITKTSGKPRRPTANRTLVVQKEHSPLDKLPHPFEAKFVGYNGKPKEVFATSKFETGNLISSPIKIKLQLFPVNEDTRIGLEKDGYCPFLELTLSPRKKISSVLKHIMTKWGRSSVAVGEARLLSCSFDNVCSTGRKVWTLDDTATCAIDVFEALGQPSIFRLWYRWFPKPQPYACASAAIPASGCSDHEAHDNCTDYYENTYSNEKKNQTSDVFSLKNVEKVADLSENNHLGASNYSEDGDLKEDCNAEKNLLLWYDSCTNISIGGLLSEVSLQGKFKSNSKPDASLSKPKQIEGFDASDMSSPHHIPPSLLDAEDTCSSFSFRKLLFSGNNAPSRDDVINMKSHSSYSTQASGQFGYSKGIDCQEEKADPIICSEVINDDRSLGLRSIKWTDSLGPFDLIAPHLGT
uniref:TSL-kinase interacting protein 1 n=1 Tax=Kalanchoe fedtschenkoi TaxID=63787 RepID=A0A7N0VFL2_KALFE